MRILVTGGAGFLGKHLCRELRARDHVVTAVDLTHGLGHKRCDVGNFRQVEDTVKKAAPHLVYNLAAEFGRHNGEEFYEQLWHTNVIGTRNVLEMQKAHGFRLVHFSSSEVYGDCPNLLVDRRWGSEQVLPYRQLNDYAITKWVNELQIMNAEDTAKTETVRVRLFNTYGPGEHYHDYRSVVCLFAYRALHGLPYTVFEGYKRTSSYVDDTIRTLANIAEKFVPGEVYNVAGGEYHEVRVLSDLILDQLGKDDRHVTYMPKDAHNTVSKKPDTEKAKRDLGHAPAVGLEEGIRRTLAWQRAVYGV